ncbi:hypothetical protein Bpfe_028544 [Biomphalaria pfeifferi]|uniref:Uncharacterized protein n=1 Tax=Biomphalaria pfeifferi TaxID=112525 RepID=A0AAD8EW23_BIOPF|nr:hypothetical protein Bpfe_028544 [Biomphalaria pfeifferi]
MNRTPHTSQNEKSKRTPSSQTLRLNSSSCFLPMEPTLRCSSREVKISDQTFGKGSYSENLLSKSKPEERQTDLVEDDERQTDLFDDEIDQNTRRLADTCKPHLKDITCQASEKGQTGVEEMLSEDNNPVRAEGGVHVRAEGGFIFTAQMKSKVPGESNCRVLKETTSDHFEENPFPLHAVENKLRLENRDSLSLSDKEFGGEIKDNYVIALLNIMNPSETSL